MILNSAKAKIRCISNCRSKVSDPQRVEVGFACPFQHTPPRDPRSRPAFCLEPSRVAFHVRCSFQRLWSRKERWTKRITSLIGASGSSSGKTHQALLKPLSEVWFTLFWRDISGNGGDLFSLQRRRTESCLSTPLNCFSRSDWVKVLQKKHPYIQTSLGGCSVRCKLDHFI